MCGRTACTLNPDAISRSCKYNTKDGRQVKPTWSKNQDKYYPSYNKAPQSYCPIILNGKHLQDGEDFNLSVADERTLVAMRWGLIPSWFSGDDVDKVSYNMNNARSDTMLEKRSYKTPLRKGQRCVVLADGFYEWKTTGKDKQPYYIYFPQPEKQSSIIKDCENGDGPSEENVRLLTMAGIFEKTFHNNEDVYSFTVITVEADESFAWLHHRMPAILTGDNDIASWLDYEHVSLEKAVQLIKPKNCLQWHPVSKYVNNSRNHGTQCCEEIDLDAERKKADGKHASEAKSLMKWLSTPNAKTQHSTSSPSKPTRSPCVKRTCGGLDRWVKKVKKDN
ncbi:abasic site processing protein HMCES-like [Clavelina lepadiformis]|uniref:abasic site processing protein HMCES-like n=1 Tax=Clavelina lepadiformis TaxID=159417 RepID=UPI00404298F6